MIKLWGTTTVKEQNKQVGQALSMTLKSRSCKMTEEGGIISKVTTPTDWVNSLVVMEQTKGKLRVCLDPGNLNEATKRPHAND